jgi:hypothetical protein
MFSSTPRLDWSRLAGEIHGLMMAALTMGETPSRSLDRDLVYGCFHIGAIAALFLQGKAGGKPLVAGRELGGVLGRRLFGMFLFLTDFLWTDSW